MENLISVIIPCYNGALYITETITSVLLQQDVTIEIIIVNDGSTDDTENTIKKIETPLIIYLKQENKGVSVARNVGLKQAKGKYIVFFDADDLMPPDFLASRLRLLQLHKNLDFASGEIQKFNELGILHGYYRGIAENAFEDILLYNLVVVTCPSNYLFRMEFLIKHTIKFNENLSSTADRFFLLQCAKLGNYVFNASVVKLNYRVSKNSMSHLLTKKLVLDNEKYYQELHKYSLIPSEIKKKSVFLGNYILAMSYLKIGNISKGLFYGVTCMSKNPMLFFKKIASA